MNEAAYPIGSPSDYPIRTESPDLLPEPQQDSYRLSSALGSIAATAETPLDKDAERELYLDHLPHTD